MFGLDTDTIRNIKDCLAKIPQIQKVLLYGSRAKGNYKNGSDIDLTLIGKNLNPDNSIYPLKEELNKLYLPYTFDISILSKLDKLEFINRILKVGKTFYQKETSELPAGWEEKRLGDVCEILDSKRKPVKKENRKKGKYPYYGATGILDYVNNYIFDEKLVLVGEDGAKWNSGDKTAFITEGKYWVNNHAHVLKPNRKKLLDEILVYSLNAKNLTSFVTGVTVPKLNQQKLRQIQIPLPPLAEQKRIVAILDKTFTTIDKIKNNTEKNLANTKELWQSYLQQSFNNPKKNWQQDKLSKLFDIQPPKKNALETLQKQDNISFVPMDCLNINNKNLTLKQTKLLKDAYSGYTYFSDNDVLLAKITPCFENGKIGIAKNLFNGIGFGSSEFIVFRNKGIVLQDYLYYYLSQKSFRHQGKNRMGGAVGHKRLAKDFIENYLLSYPISLTEQKQITERLDYLSQKTTALQETYCKKIQNLIELKNSLLQNAFSGEL